MFIKVTKSGKHRYAQLVQSYRENGKIKHRVLLNLGRTDFLSQDQGMKKLAANLVKITNPQEVLNTEGVSEARIVRWGDVVFKKLWEDLEINKIIELCAAKPRLWFDLNSTVLHLVTRHLLSPREENYFISPKLTSNTFYRTLDILGKYKKEIERSLLPEKPQKPLLAHLVPFVFKNVSPEELTRFSYDRNLKQVKTQGMFISDFSGRLLSYELFPEEKFGRANIEKSLSRIQNNFGIPHPILISDQNFGQDFYRNFPFISAAFEDIPEDVTGIYYGIKTNLKKEKPENILKSYHHLERFKELFIPQPPHPALQWTERRIRGHFVLCFMAALLENTLVKKLNRKGQKASPARIYQALDSLQFAQFESSGIQYLLKIEGEKLSPEILEIFQLPSPKNLLTAEEFSF